MEQAMTASNVAGRIRVAIAGVGNCAASLAEGISFYRQHPSTTQGLLFPKLGSYSVGDIDIAVAFDIAEAKVGRPIQEAIYQSPNNFVRIPGLRLDADAPVLRGPTFDGNPEHLARFVHEAAQPPVDVGAALRDYRADVLINLLPTGSIAATEYYAQAALEAGCAFVNCIPTVLAQRPEIQARYAEKQLPLLGDDIKSQIGTTILHRALLHLLEMRGATLDKTSQVNIGGNTDFANFVYRADTKLVSKRKSLARYLNADTAFHVGHHYDPTKGALKNAFIDIEASVFGGSPVKIAVRLESDDKPNSAGSVADLIRIAKAARDRRLGGIVREACAFYMKSPPVQIDDLDALDLVREHWAG
jgi:myo-inositol-1-phosphate synthase